MTSFMCTLSIFVALMSTVHCIKCKQCWSRNATECYGDTIVDCPNACVTYSEKCIVDGKSLLSVRSGCEYNPILESVACNQFLSIKTAAGVGVNVFAKCCSTDLCNENQQYESSSATLFWTLSALLVTKCPSCYKAGSTEECLSSSHVACNLITEQCVSYIGLIQLADGTVQNMSFKGCVTRRGCEFGFAVLPGTIELKRKEMKCTEALSTVW
ncbi:uncharacterized protein LOC142496608 [Ascaphus truei]|uniref:uncharacterized protein LOC142496608 n=1 Tax=Ascaphus truei TaxID=8439 RepID=UPI003F592813